MDQKPDSIQGPVGDLDSGGLKQTATLVGRRRGFRASRGTDDRWMPPTAYAIIIVRRGRRQMLLWCQVEVALNWIEVDNLRAMVSRR